MNAVVFGQGARLWRSDGMAATVTQVGQIGAFARIDGERRAAHISGADWRLALTCDYCDRPAEVQLRDGAAEDVLCKVCARGQFDRVADWVRPIPRTVIKALYGECRRLG
jgi:hypothetical protein